MLIFDRNRKTASKAQPTTPEPIPFPANLVAKPASDVIQRDYRHLLWTTDAGALLPAPVEVLVRTHLERSAGEVTHGAALADGESLLVVAEDVGRHNAVDKVKGEALMRRIATEERILLSTGRVSSEMLLKAARMGVPIVASRTSPTEMAVALAEQLNVTVCGYVRAESLNLYTGHGILMESAPLTRA